MRLTRRQALAGAAVGAAGAAGIYELVDQLTGATPQRAAVGVTRPEQHLLDGIRVVQSDDIPVLVPPLHHEILTAHVNAERGDDVAAAQLEFELLLGGLE